MREPAFNGRVELSCLARDAAAGDEHAWTELVRRLDGVLRGVARRYRLAAADVDHVGRLQDPGAIAGWLVVTTRREAMRTLQRGVREVLTDDTSAIDDPDPAGPDVVAIERERHTALHGAVERLTGRQRVLMSSMLSTPAPTYEQLSTRLAMPVGSIGPTRERALARLREDSDLARAVAA
jgi:DNA-directed RNA polymerase specialized sigma24 family protein